MLFSEKFKISPKTLKEYGAVNISLVNDIPLFIDPMLIFNSNKKEYKELHKNIIKYFHFLAKKSQCGLSYQEIKTWFSFNEVCQNWLGYSLKGNKGQGSAMEFAKFLNNNINFAINTHGISEDVHIEKVSLIYPKNGKDKISDMTVNLIKYYLCEYTQEFAKKYLKESEYKKFPVEKSGFNYITESFISKDYELPYLTCEDGKDEYILLTPRDILRKEEQSINFNSFIIRNEEVRNSISNDVLKTQVNNYIAKAIGIYEKEQQKINKKAREKEIKKIESNAFIEQLKQYPEIYDYYIKMIENEKDNIALTCMEEVKKQEKMFIEKAYDIKVNFQKSFYADKELSFKTAKEATVYALGHLKHCIEDCGLYKDLYVNDEKIASEDSLRRMLRLVWHDIDNYCLDFDTNNGRGEVDTLTSKGENNKCIAEFKLASNPKLINVLEQLSVYNKANNVNKNNNIIVIFYFSEKEHNSAVKILKELAINNLIGLEVFLIDCRKDNKESASKVKKQNKH